MTSFKKARHTLLGHGQSYIEEHTFHVGAHSSGVLYNCHGCDSHWFVWEQRYAGDLVKPLIPSSSLVAFVGGDR